VAFDVANAPACGPGVDWRAVDPAEYEQVLFVCGPFRDNAITAEFLGRFRGRRLIGLDLSMLQSVRQWNPFDVLFERDSDRTQRPDLVFAAEEAPVPVVGLLLVHPQPQYGERALHDMANKAIRGLIDSRPMSVVPIDTCLEGNKAGLRTPAEIESLIARMDVVVTTRLHGLVLALKNNVPALAVDPIAGGAKIRQQCQAVGWPVVFTADALLDADLHAAFDYCLTAEARAKATLCRLGALDELDALRKEFADAVNLSTAQRE
ncbi:MAG: polysaccharide pyruvyl transferase family protein, partial [Tepidisphaeraceae bacterium]